MPLFENTYMTKVPEKYIDNEILTLATTSPSRWYMSPKLLSPVLFLLNAIIWLLLLSLLKQRNTCLIALAGDNRKCVISDVHTLAVTDSDITFQADGLLAWCLSRQMFLGDFTAWAVKSALQRTDVLAHFFHLIQKNNACWMQINFLMTKCL